MSEVVTAAATPAPATASTATPAPATTQSNSTAPASAAKVAEELFDVPVDGKIVKMTRAEMIKEASLAKGAHKRFEDAAKMRREAEGLLSRLRDPKEAIKLLNDPKLGLDKKQIQSAFEEWYQDTVIKPSEMSPAERRAAEAEARVAEYERKEKEEKERLEAEQNEKLDAQTVQEIQKEVVSLMEQSGLPKTRFTAARLAHWIRINESQGLNAGPDLILRQVKKEMHDVTQSLVSASDGDVLVNLLGEETVKKIRAHDLARIRARRQQGENKVVAQEDKPPQEREKITVQEWKKRLREWN
jgi:hypothetical protein